MYHCGTKGMIMSCEICINVSKEMIDVKDEFRDHAFHSREKVKGLFTNFID